MADTHTGSLQIQQDLAHERREWRVERAAWVVVGLILVAALAGVLGSGPLSAATASSSDGALRVHYHRFARYQAPERLDVEIAPRATLEGRVRVWVNAAFVRSVELQHIDPRPDRVEAGPDRFVYTFGFTGGGGARIVTFRFEPDTYGRLPADVGLESGPHVAFTPFVYP